MKNIYLQISITSIAQCKSGKSRICVLLYKVLRTLPEPPRLPHCVAALNRDKVEMAQAKTGGLSCDGAEPKRGEGLRRGDESREQGASAC